MARGGNTPTHSNTTTPHSTSPSISQKKTRRNRGVRVRTLLCTPFLLAMLYYNSHPTQCNADLGLALTANPPRSTGRRSGGCDSANVEGPRTSMAERGRLLSRSTGSGTGPRDGVRRPPGGALPSRLRKGDGTPLWPGACCITAFGCAPRTRAAAADGRPAIGAPARTLCSESTAEVMCTERGPASCCCSSGDTARCAASRAARSALSAAAPTGEVSRSDRSSAGAPGGKAARWWLARAARG